MKGKVTFEGYNVLSVLFCLYFVVYVLHTKLYSFKLSCNIVSFTAANTKRIFSVSESGETKNRL